MRGRVYERLVGIKAGTQAVVMVCYGCKVSFLGRQ